MTFPGHFDGYPSRWSCIQCTGIAISGTATGNIVLRFPFGGLVLVVHKIGLLLFGLLVNRLLEANGAQTAGSV